MKNLIAFVLLFMGTMTGTKAITWGASHSGNTSYSSTETSTTYTFTSALLYVHYWVDSCKLHYYVEEYAPQYNTGQESGEFTHSIWETIPTSPYYNSGFQMEIAQAYNYPGAPSFYTHLPYPSSSINTYSGELYLNNLTSSPNSNVVLSTYAQYGDGISNFIWSQCYLEITL